MDDLRKRLEGLRQARGLRGRPGQSLEAARSGDSSKTSSIREQLVSLEKRRSWGRDVRAGPAEEPRALCLEEVLGGREVTTPFGACYEIKAVYRDTYRHGQHSVGAFHDVDFNTLRLFCGGEDGEDIRPEDVLFIDLESTGLSLGTGTYAFLIGMGYFREGRYNVHQLFLRDFDEEPALLHHAKQLIDSFRCLVTFNGKRFDIPLLEARFSMCSQPEAMSDMVSWDLLYPARRLWYDRLEDCRLETIERERLNVTRESMDIPGDRIPQVFFRYVHQGDARDIDRIAYHNAMDVLSLTALAIHIDRSLKEKDPIHSNLFSVGRYYERRGIQEVGGEYYEIASCRGSCPEERDKALFHLAMQRKREGEIDRAVAIWRELIDREGDRFLECCVEIAKHLEHKTRELDEAIQTVSFALARVGPQDVRLSRDLQKRLKRLRRKKGEACRG